MLGKISSMLIKLTFKFRFKWHSETCSTPPQFQMQRKRSSIWSVSLRKIFILCIRWNDFRALWGLGVGSGPLLTVPELSSQLGTGEEIIREPMPKKLAAIFQRILFPAI